LNGALLAIFYVVDSTLFRREDLATPGDLDEVAVAHQVPLSLAGKRNFLYLAGVVGVLLASGTLGLPFGVQEGGMLLMVALSWFTTRRELRVENRFTWGPIVEVAVVFLGIFCTMIPALAILNAKGSALGLTEPWQFFWATGALSSFLDNAPTYITFAAAASAIQGTDAGNLSTLIATETGTRYLVAISLGAVFMGANTYIGNGPNFMVKAIAEQSGVRMPGFFGYMAWSCAILLPLFAAITWLFLV
jgi:Na+/H+ antiporter NhaD/arsenite permease-like protein